MTLTEFLLARIAEDEAAANAAFDNDPVDSDLQARFTSARVLAECEAKRRIVGLHGDDHECSTFDHHGERDNCTWVIGDDCSTMRLLALPYADHEDYREEWKL